MNPRMRGVLQCFPGALNIRTARSCQTSDDRTAHCLRNRLYRLKIAVRSDRESRLNDVNAQPVQLLRQAQLFLLVHAAAGRLLTIAKSGIKNFNAYSIDSHKCLPASLRRAAGVDSSRRNPSETPSLFV